MRLFLALDPPLGFKRRLAKVQGELLGSLPQTMLSRPVPWQNLHLTLLFFGEVSVPELIEIKRLSRRETSRAPALTLVTDRFGFLGANLVSLFQRNRSLDRLVHRLRNEAVAAWLSFEDQKFRPHLTLLRFKAEAQNLLLRFGSAQRLDRKFSAT